MGQDYSYSQPSSSEEYDERFACLLQGEADGESSYNNAEVIQYPAQPECNDGVPQRCYCGAEPFVKTAYTSKDPGRRYFSCENVDDGDCHIWKWVDVAVLEELSDIQREARLVKDQCTVMSKKLARVEKTDSEIEKKQSVVTKGLVLGVCVLETLLVCVVSAMLWLGGRTNSSL